MRFPDVPEQQLNPPDIEEDDGDLTIEERRYLEERVLARLEDENEARRKGTW